MTQKKKQHTKTTYNDYFFHKRRRVLYVIIIFYYQNTRTRSSTNSSFKKTAFNHPSYIIYIRDKHINHNNNIITSFLLDVVSIVDLLTFDPCIYRYYESDNNTLFAINNPGEY